jgi:HK97 family phage portal protein
MYGGSANSGKVLILQEGVEATPWTMPLADAQWIERSYLSIEDICRVFGVPPHKVQLLLRATNNNIEQQSQDFLSDALDPDLTAEEQELDWKLIAPQERPTLYTRFERKAAIQMDSAARRGFYEGMTRIGAMNIDEVRAREEMNAVSELRGTVHFVPSSQMPAPTPEQSDKLLDKWSSTGGGKPAPDTNGQVAGATSA